MLCAGHTAVSISVIVIACLLLLCHRLNILAGSSDDITRRTGDGNDGVCNGESTDGVCRNSAADASSYTSLLEDNADAFCQENSQTSLAVQMLNFSSPKGSPSFAKMKRILAQHHHFYLDLGGSQGVFDSVTINLATMLEGYGMTRLHSLTHPGEDKDMNVLVVHTLFSKWKDDQGRLFLERPNASVVILQTEQICCSPYGQRALMYFNACHQSPNCVIWEYSDLNLKWLQEQKLGDSTLLLPTLHQNRLDPYLPKRTKNNDIIKPLSERPIEVVFFGVMTDRRQKIAVQIRAIAAGRWQNIVLEEVENSGSKLSYMAEQYAQTKICLVVHSFQQSTPGEYHRLSELAKSGCVPIMETFGDTVGIDVYSRCGGVVFSDLSNIPYAIQGVLDDLEPHDAALSKRVQWWDNRIQWEHLLNEYF